MQCDNIISTFAPCLSDSFGVSPDVANFIGIFLGVLLVATFPLIITILLIWVERKFAARVADRLGPNRVGPFGLIQPLADVVKLLGKEDIVPTGADKLIYNVAPVMSLMAVTLIWAVIPLTPVNVGVDLSIGALYFVSVASLGTLAIILAGWSSNNKYALLGAFRVVAQLISYEVPLALSLLIPVMLTGSMRLIGIVEAQAGMWFVFMVPISAFLFFISSQAETGRSPFDLIEAESELTAGFNTEYAGMKFGMFYAGEFMHVFTNGILMATLFTGGYYGPFVHELPVLGVVYLLLKGSAWYFLSLLLRNTLPRVRIDQLMLFNWLFLVPIAIVNVLMVSLLLMLVREVGLAPDDPQDFIQNIPQTFVLLLGNGALFALILTIIRNRVRRERMMENRALVVAAGD